MNSLTLKKSRRFLSSKSPPMELETMKKPTQDDDFFHFSHPYHPLVLTNLPYLFTCNGCKEHGAGKRYKCEICEFDLHDFCALAPRSLHNHPFHPQHELFFCAKSGGRSKCDICGKATKGYSFRCTPCGFDMHPCCATMNQQMNFPPHHHTLILLPCMANDANFVCAMCRRKRSGQVYTCLPCGYYLHAICAKDMVNGLYVHGIKPHEKSNLFGNAAKVASHAILGIIGGLIEGIGEGIGEAFMNNIGRGTRSVGKK
ncbi:uncharacterized protein LOC109844478 isoform X2 [Asparagus officinalis]|uniref:uncharacterized protein LOC109844478 isoform X2 n=1 Tax=Asparagus officinalis TaxID=4686 RepID=UPI00098E163B|nr:uncharacterized protein LOC109844478 isoform X2 [Asparagus officinalis]